MKELLVTAKPAGNVPLKRLDAICGSATPRHPSSKWGAAAAAAHTAAKRPAANLLLRRSGCGTQARVLSAPAGLPG